MLDGFVRARRLVTLYERYFKFGGTWPLENGRTAYARFTFYMIYNILQYILQCIELVMVFHDVKMVMPCFLETTWNTLALPKMVLMRMSTRLPKLVTEILEEMRNEAFTTVEERNCYLEYSEKAISLAKILIPGTIYCCVMHVGAALGFLIKTALSANGTIPVITPYHTYMFFEVTSYYTLVLFWIVEMINIWTQIFYSTSLGFVIWMIYHVGGQLSALGCRIRNLDTELGEDKKNANAIFRAIAKKYSNIKSMMTVINDIFYFIFLEEVFALTSMIIITIYAVVADPDVVDLGRSVESGIIGGIMLLLIYAPCVAGERIHTESAEIRDAYYYFRWYELPEDSKKSLMICMIGSIRPLQVQAGTLFIFCLPSFIVILKSAMSYLSVLRTIT